MKERKTHMTKMNHMSEYMGELTTFNACYWPFAVSRDENF